MAASGAHTPVLLEEALEALAIRADGRYLDATFGRGGHSAAILAQLNERGQVLALDRDPEAIAAGRKLFAADRRLVLAHCDFGRLSEAARAALGDLSGGFNGVLFDLGVSSPQLDDASRGFSFMQDGPLDMRMDNTHGVTVATWLAGASEQEIARVLRDFGEERYAKRIARALVAARKECAITRTAQLAAIVAAAAPTREPGKHPATRTFQAMRILINAELEQLERALAQSVELLAPSGRLCVISFHSLEDRIVKQFMQRCFQEDPVYAGLPHVPEHARPKLRRVGRTIHSSAAEIARNPRARSAIMRVAERRAA